MLDSILKGLSGGDRKPSRPERTEGAPRAAPSSDASRAFEASSYQAAALAGDAGGGPAPLLQQLFALAGQARVPAAGPRASTAGVSPSVLDLMADGTIRSGDHALAMIAASHVPEHWSSPLGQGIAQFALRRYAMVATTTGRRDGELDGHLQGKLVHAASVLWQLNDIITAQTQAGMTLDPHWRMLVEYAALLHDIGYVDGGFLHAESGSRDVLYDVRGRERLATLNRVLPLRENGQLRRGRLSVDHLAAMGPLAPPYANLKAMLQRLNQPAPTAAQLAALERELPPYEDLNDALRAMGAPTLSQQDLEKVAVLIQLHGSSFPWDRLDDRLPGTHYVAVDAVRPIFADKAQAFADGLRTQVNTNGHYLQMHPGAFAWLGDRNEVVNVLSAGWLLHSADNFNGPRTAKHAESGDDPSALRETTRRGQVVGRHLPIATLTDLNDLVRASLLRQVVGELKGLLSGLRPRAAASFDFDEWGGYGDAELAPDPAPALPEAVAKQVETEVDGLTDALDQVLSGAATTSNAQLAAELARLLSQFDQRMQTYRAHAPVAEAVDNLRASAPQLLQFIRTSREAGSASVR